MLLNYSKIRIALFSETDDAEEIITEAIRRGYLQKCPYGKVEWVDSEAQKQARIDLAPYELSDLSINELYQLGETVGYASEEKFQRVNGLDNHAIFGIYFGIYFIYNKEFER